MKQSEFIERLSIMEENILRREKTKIDQSLTKDYCFVSANLSNFLPGLPLEVHEAFYIELMQHRSLAVFHSNLAELVNTLNLTGDFSFLKDIGTRPYIFCNYHLGSYRALMGFLVSKQIDFALLLDNRTFAQQGEKIQESINSLMYHCRTIIEFRMFNVEDPASMMQIGQWLRSGKSLVAYLDGNTGYGGVYNNSKEVFLQLDFMGMPIRNRKGISMLSHVSKTPIIPAISYFLNREAAPWLEFSSPIYPEAGIQKEEYIADSTKKLYQVLETKLRDFPSQWEPWLYIHKFLDTEALKEKYKNDQGNYNGVVDQSVKYSFNKRKYGLFRLDDVPHLFDRMLYSTYEINNDVFAVFKDCYDRKDFFLSEIKSNENFLRQLLAQEIIQVTE